MRQYLRGWCTPCKQTGGGPRRDQDDKDCWLELLGIVRMQKFPVRIWVWKCSHRNPTAEWHSEKQKFHNVSVGFEKIGRDCWQIADWFPVDSVEFAVEAQTTTGRTMPLKWSRPKPNEVWRDTQRFAQVQCNTPKLTNSECKQSRKDILTFSWHIDYPQMLSRTQHGRVLMLSHDQDDHGQGTIGCRPSRLD